MLLYYEVDSVHLRFQRSGLTFVDNHLFHRVGHQQMGIYLMAQLKKFKEQDVVLSWLENGPKYGPSKSSVMVQGYLHPDNPEAAGQTNPNLTTTRYKDKDGKEQISNATFMSEKQVDAILAAAGDKVNRVELENGNVRIEAGIKADLMRVNSNSNTRGVIVNTKAPMVPTEHSMDGVFDKKVAGVRAAKAAKDAEKAAEAEAPAVEAQAEAEAPAVDAQEFEAGA